MYKAAKPNEHVDIVYHWIICHSLSLYSSLLNTQTVTPRGPTVSQADRLIWPPDHIQCIDERIVVAKQRALETSNFVRYVFHTRTDIRDHRRERWRDPSIVGGRLQNETKESWKDEQFLLTSRTLHIERSDDQIQTDYIERYRKALSQFSVIHSPHYR